MAENSKISWTDATWNPWHGCDKVSEGCKYCYMFREKERYGQNPFDVVKSKTKWKDPLKWKEPKKIFTCSWSDFFIEQADAWRPEAWDMIRNSPQHIFQILTKRPERILAHLPPDWGAGYDNVWLGVSAENDMRLRERLRILRTIPAKIKWVSLEPLLEGLPSLPEIFTAMKIDWVVVGGESGNLLGSYRFRFCSQWWIENVVEICQAYKVPVFVKQLGTYISRANNLKAWSGDDMAEFPKKLQIQQFPIISKETTKTTG